MLNLNVCGPFHFDEFDQKGKFIAQRNSGCLQPDVPGIYIWGFVYHKIDGKLGEPTSGIVKLNNSHQFIPHYVGIHQKEPIFKRIKQHHDTNKNENTKKYIRFSKEYMKEFFVSESGFPIHIGNNFVSKKFDQLVKLNKCVTNITYHNHCDVLLSAQPTLSPSPVRGQNNPITDWDGTNGKSLLLTPTIDTLDWLVNTLNNFWFCFIPLSQQDCNLNNLTHVDIETYVYYCLKGKTISNTNHCPKSNPTIQWTIDKTARNLFKNGNNPEPSYFFPGYL
jgi:hypothetical protein